MEKLLRSIVGIIHIVVFSKWFSKSYYKIEDRNNKLIILGNGSSLNTIDLSFEDADIMVLNRHVIADNYSLIRPRYYTIADPHFFSHPEGLGILNKISELTKWDMVLFIPHSRSNTRVIKQNINNGHIKTVYYNYYDFQGYNFLAYKLYNLQLAMPRVQNVLVAAIMNGILMKYERIELYGVEHSWTKNLYVGNDNLVYLYNPHFYDKESVVAQPIKDIHNQSEAPFWFVLDCYMKMFKSYSIIKDYIKKENIKVRVLNKTPESFIDAFERE